MGCDQVSNKVEGKSEVFFRTTTRPGPMQALPKWKLIPSLVFSVLIYLGLAALGWRGWGPLMAHPARAGAVLTVIVSSIAALFTRGNLSSGQREDTANRWIFLPLLVLGFLGAWLPAYTDRANIASIDGDLARYTGLILFAVGSLVRLVPVFVLGNRFSGLVAIQENHELATTGPYRLIRHPSYLGLILALFGWALVFRSIFGLILAVLTLPILVARMNSEEAFLESEFGDSYANYRSRTWRLLPYLY